MSQIFELSGFVQSYFSRFPKELDASPLPLVKESMQNFVASPTKSSYGEAFFLKSEASSFCV